MLGEYRILAERNLEPSLSHRIPDPQVGRNCVRQKKIRNTNETQNRPDLASENERNMESKQVSG